MEHGPESSFGYEPRPAVRHLDEDRLPKWWPLYADGHIMRYVYLRIDEENGYDKKIPNVSEDMSHILKENKAVDFSDLAVKHEVLRQVNAGPLDMDPDRKGPFLSTSIDLDSLLAYGDRKLPSQTGEDERKFIGRIDLMALWLYDKLTEHSFANISSSKKYNHYFKQLSLIHILRAHETDS